ncbi:MAG: hypothetical protein WC850_06300 [Candidatus Gracilibacteria bacterium]
MDLTNLIYYIILNMDKDQNNNSGELKEKLDTPSWEKVNNKFESLIASLPKKRILTDERGMMSNKDGNVIEIKYSGDRISIKKVQGELSTWYALQKGSLSGNFVIITSEGSNQEKLTKLTYPEEAMTSLSKIEEKINELIELDKQEKIKEVNKLNNLVYSKEQGDADEYLQKALS